MKRTIESHCMKIFWQLPGSVWPQAIVAGGFIRSFYDDSEPKDVDLFFRSARSLVRVARELMRNGWYVAKTSDANARAYPNAEALKAGGLYFNLVGSLGYGEPAEIINRFDFTCCQFAAKVADFSVEVTAAPTAAADATNKVLVATKLCNLSHQRIERYVGELGYVDRASEDVEACGGWASMGGSQ